MAYWRSSVDKGPIFYSERFLHRGQKVPWTHTIIWSVCFIFLFLRVSKIVSCIIVLNIVTVLYFLFSMSFILLTSIRYSYHQSLRSFTEVKYLSREYLSRKQDFYFKDNSNYQVLYFLNFIYSVYDKTLKFSAIIIERVNNYHAIWPEKYPRLVIVWNGIKYDGTIWLLLME